MTESGAGPKSLPRMDKPLGLSTPDGALQLEAMYIGDESACLAQKMDACPLCNVSVLVCLL